MEPLVLYAAYLAWVHARDQEEIAAELALGLLPLWSLVNFRELDASMSTWLPAVLPRVKTAFLQSQRVTAVFTQNVRFANLPLEAPLNLSLPDVEQPANLSVGAFNFPENGTDGALAVFDEFPEEDVKASLAIEADYNTKKQMPGPEDELMNKALIRSSGAAVRQAINGSRGVTQNLTRDRRVLGFARVTDLDPCAFCALLASRGAVFTKGSFDKSDPKFTPHPDATKGLPKGFSDVSKVHNSCRCTLRPIYTRSASFDDAATYWRNAWDSITKNDPYASNSEHLSQFREWHKENPYPGAQFDLYALDVDLVRRKEALLNSGFSPDSPQIRWVDRSRQGLAA